MNKIITTLAKQPRQVFLIDALGALLTCFLLGVLLIWLQEYIGLSTNTLYKLAIIPIFFAVYSFSCFFFLEKNWSPYLKVIAVLNILYCVTTAILIFTSTEITPFGITYFLLEIIIVLAIAFIELQIAKKQVT